jgi:hypothetical protein
MGMVTFGHDCIRRGASLKPLRWWKCVSLVLAIELSTKTGDARLGFLDH